MAVDNLKFSVEIDEWAKATLKRQLAIFHESTKRLVSKAQSRVPIDTGFARASVRGSTRSMPPIDQSKSAPFIPGRKPRSGAVYSYDRGDITAVIIGAKLGDVIYVGWTANYVPYLEKGHSKQAPSGFVAISAMEWPQIVREVIEQAKARAS